MIQKKPSASDVDEQTKPAEPADEMPKREPLTPELVEDEAIRGDFMLRWALVLLTFLMACTLIAETRTLVHIRSGEYTISNFFMPARTGVFSASAEEQPWRNLSWLFDVVLAGTYSLTGAIGLSVLKAIIAAVAFGVIVHTNRKDVSSWWGTICAVLAMLVCYPQMTAQPEIVTMLGLALTLYWLNRWREDGERKYLIRLIILFAVWSNLDPRMYLGLAVIGLYAAGEWTGNWLGFSSGLQNGAQRKSLWIAFGLCLAATMLNPFGWHALLSPAALYGGGGEYEAFRELHPTVGQLRVLQFYPMTHLMDLPFSQSWGLLNHNMFAGGVLILTALVTFGLNHRRLDFGHLFIGMGFLAFAVLTTRDLAAAAIVCGVLATLNAQQWYQHTFRQDYSVQTSELVFSRGGRAVTVLALFGLAYLAISGQLYLLDKQGRMSRRAGFGFDDNLQSSIDGLREDMQDSLDDRPFNFSESQGDLLIWIGQKPFIDSRLGLYSSLDGDLIGRFSKTRNSLRKGVKSNSKGEGWKAVLDEFQVTHVTPRLDIRISTPFSDYLTHMALLDSNDWQLTRFGASSSVFYRTDVRKSNVKLDEYLNGHRIRFTDFAFRSKSQKTVARSVFARQLTFTEKYLSRPKPQTPNGVLLARHYGWLYERIIAEGRASGEEGQVPRLPRNIFQGSQAESFLVSLLILQIRSANAGLLEDPQNSEAYSLLGYAYQNLMDFERRLVAKDQGASDLQEAEKQLRFGAFQSSQLRLATMRLRQAAVAFQQSLVISPDRVDAARALARTFEQQQRSLDAAVNMLTRAVEIANANPLPAGLTEAAREFQTRLRKADSTKLTELRQQIQPALEQIEKSVPKMSLDETGRPVRMQAVEFAMNNRCLNRAVELMDDDLEMVSLSPRIAMLYVDSLLNLGRIEDAASRYDEYNSKFEMLVQIEQWRLLGAAIAVCQGDYSRAKGVFDKAARDHIDDGLFRLMDETPLAVNSALRLPKVFAKFQNPGTVDIEIEPWAMIQNYTVLQAMYQYPDRAADHLLSSALCDLELGNTKAAAVSLDTAIESAPDSAIRPLARFYWQLITGETKPALPPAVGNSAKSKTVKSNSKQTAPVKAKKTKQP